MSDNKEALRIEILKYLEKHSRVDLSELAALMGAEETEVANEMAEMEKEKIICGYHTLIDWDKTGVEMVTALIEVRVTPQRDRGFDRLAERIYNYPEVYAVYLISGSYDLLVTLEGKSLKEVSRFVSEKLSPIEGVLNTATHFILHQIQFHKRRDIDRNRRTDVTLLINGLPMIHIELKNRAHSTKEAFNQIQKYIDEQMFNGIYSTIQMFVVSNGTYTQYIAAGQQLREKFLTNWVDEDNKQIQSLIPFAQKVLSIPAAHNMIADYEVLDSEQKNIILLRPYQIHAIEAIKEAAYKGKDHEPISGYIWHTTGSGKTLTSYKVAHNLLRIPSLQKAVFLIDRKDLDTQTTQAFQTYAENDSIDVEETENSYVLAKKLTSPDKKVVVTTRQKMQALFKRIEEDQSQKRLYQKLCQVKLAFVVDECHRAVSPDQKNELDSFFKIKPLWYGFTGTPIFAENAREEKGNNARTTEQQYGPCLHKYTIKDAIRDNAVLGFNVEEEKNYTIETDDREHDELVNEYLSLNHMKSV